jgi:hypothetical protein
MPSEGEQTSEPKGGETPPPPAINDVVRAASNLPSLPTLVQQQQPGTPAAKASTRANNDGEQLDRRGTISDATSASEEEAGGPKTPPEKPKRHYRGVSWNEAVADNVRVTLPGGLLQPELAYGDSNSPSLMATTAEKPNLPPRPAGISRNTSRNTSKGSEVRFPEPAAGKMFNEIDAESSVMRSIEDRDPLRPHSGTGSSIFSGLPMEQLQHDFSIEGKDVRHSPQKGHPAPSPHGTPPRTPPRPRTTSRDVKVQPKSKAQLHRRQLTVDQALFGLTSALSAIKTQENNQDVMAEVEAEEMGNRQRAETGASTDRLAATAQMMFKRMSKRDVTAPPQEISTDGAPFAPKNQVKSKWDLLRENTSQHEAPSPPKTQVKSKWGVVKESIDQHKKTDSGQDSDMPDIEVGADLADQDDFTDQDQTHYEDTQEENNIDGGRKSRKGKKKLNPFMHLPYADKIKNEWEVFNNFLTPRKTTMFAYARYTILYLWLPALGVAALLFHLPVFDNPPTGKFPPESSEKASASWWIIFVCIRQVSIVAISKCLEVLIVDFLALQTTAILRSCGALFTLLVVQSKGWPFLMMFWGIFNFALVTGDSPFNKHWLYWQDVWGLFNETNPSGTVTSSTWFSIICTVSAIVGAAVSVKRVAVGVVLGRQTFSNYSEQLAKVMNKMLQISQVAALAREIEKKFIAQSHDEYFGRQKSMKGSHFSSDNLTSLIATTDAEDAGDERSFVDATRSVKSDEEMEKVIDADDIDPYTGRLSFSQRARISEFLGRWEEPARAPTQLVRVQTMYLLHE